MDRFLKQTLLILLLLAFVDSEPKDPIPVDKSLLCSKSSCDGVDCPKIPDDCDGQNATHSGIWMDSPTICNCCQFCLVNLRAGDLCTQGSLGSPPTGTVCGPGLTCVPTAQKSRCLRMDSPCHKDQDDYDNRRELGTLGFLETRPICDGRGEYGVVHCITGKSCFCMSKTGKRIFGESINDKEASLNMKCGCSRAVDLVSSLIGGQATGRRCLPDGSYDPIQCLKNRCFCVNPITGDISSSQVIDGSTQALTALPCFNSSIHHSNTAYLRECEEYRLEVLETLKESEEEGYTLLGNPIPNCQPDGNFNSIQFKDKKRVCVDASGKQIFNFGLDISSPASKNMNCKCARTWNLLKLASAVSLPTCCPDGNWRPTQCRGNFCYCVDQDGRQKGMEVRMDQVEELKCGNNKNWKEC